MTPIALLLATLGLILLPLALLTWRQRSSRAARIAQAWRGARDKERLKTETLQAIERRLENLVASEQALLATIRQLQEQIDGLPDNATQDDSLEEIRTGTASTIRQLAELMEAQVDGYGEARLKDVANQLAARHADSGTAVARLQDVLQEDVPGSLSMRNETPKQATAEDSLPDLEEFPQEPAPLISKTPPLTEEQRIH